MKTSNKIIFGLVATLLAATIIVDLSLKEAYLKVNLSDPFKNYTSITLRPFKHLKIIGGNSYAIKIRQTTQTNLKVMNSRKGFLNTAQHGDTLVIWFTVQSSLLLRDPESLPLGIIIGNSRLTSLDANGTNNILDGWQTDILKLNLTGNATACFRKGNIQNINVKANQNAIIDFKSANYMEHVSIRLQNDAKAFLRDVRYISFTPVLRDNSEVIFGARSIDQISGSRH